MQSVAGRALQGMLCSGNVLPMPGAAVQQQVALVGFAVVRAWHFLVNFPSGKQSQLMMRCCKPPAKEGRTLGYVEHEVVAAVALVDPIDLEPDWSFRNAELLGNELFNRTTSVDMYVYNGTVRVALLHGSTALRTRWRVLLGDFVKCVAWPLWTPMAYKVVHRQWGVDMTTVRMRERKLRWLPPVRPPTHAKMAYLQWVANNTYLLWSVDTLPPAPVATCLPPHSAGPRPAFDSRHVVNMVRATRGARNVRGAFLEENFRSLMLSLFPDKLSSMDQFQDGSFKVPSQQVLESGRIRLDICAMLTHRVLAKSEPAFRYLFFDASPQRSGREVFATCERLVPLTTVEGSSCLADIPVTAMVDRRLPICGLGQGHTTVPDKVMCLVHQCWLEYGPAASDVRAANARVRQCLSDMGTEFAICDYPDVVDEYLVGSTKLSEVRSKQGFLFPLALKIPGSLHIIDWVLQRACCSFSWWPHWSAKSKLIMQFMSSKNQRERMQEWLAKADIEEAERGRLIKSLDRSANRFAHWRWQTLREVTSAMVRFRDAMRVAAASPNGPVLFESKEDKSRELRSAILDSATWDMTEALIGVIRPLTDLSGWIKGCDCHQEQLNRGLKIKCQWKGCRGRCSLPSCRGPWPQWTTTARRSLTMVPCLSRILHWPLAWRWPTCRPSSIGSQSRRT